MGEEIGTVSVRVKSVDIDRNVSGEAGSLVHS